MPPRGWAATVIAMRRFCSSRTGTACAWASSCRCVGIRLISTKACCALFDRRTARRHACGYKLANDGQDTRAIQHYLGHRNIMHTVCYTELASDRFKGFWDD